MKGRIESATEEVEPLINEERDKINDSNTAEMVISFIKFVFNKKNKKDVCIIRK